MCGIAGIFNYADPERPADRDLLVRMTRALAHRGPDDEGFYLEGPLGLGHRRLSIVDLSPTGHQPMATPDRSCWISYNGEFYNHRDFRGSLEGKGYRFRGTSDTETLVCLLQDRGPGVLRDLAAIFALAFWESGRRRLILARDPLGVKQLYYHDDGRRILFANEVKAILESPDVPRSPDPEAINQYLHFHTPLFERTFFDGIRQLRQGESLTVSRQGVQSRVYWTLENWRQREGTPEEDVGQLREMLAKVVGDQLMSDVPVGAFFSGGIDSTAVAAFAARAGKAPQLFGVHFSNQGVIDERPYQEAAARALGLPLQLTTLDGSSLPEDFERLMYFQDQPVIGPAMIPMYHVSKLAAGQVKVCLGGQAGDEIFGGYARYALAEPWRVVGSLFAGSRRGGRSRPASGRRLGGNLLKQLADPRIQARLLRILSHPRDWRARYFASFAHIPENAWRGLLAEGFVSRTSCRELFMEEVSSGGPPDPATAAMHWDMRAYLPGLFHQDDRMSMAHGLESRVPLADPRLVAFAFNSRPDLKLRGGATKWMLRQAIADAVPEEVLNRRKVGFDTPVESWFRGRHRGFIRDLLLSTDARRRGLFKPAGLERLLGAPGRSQPFELVWKVACIEMWARVFLDGRPGGIAPRATELRSRERPRRPRPADLVQEVRELGLENALFRARWEIRARTAGGNSRSALAAAAEIAGMRPRESPLFPDPREVAQALAGRIPDGTLRRLQETAREAGRGRILCFGRWAAEFGTPLDWHLNPVTGGRSDERARGSRVLRSAREAGDVKLTWEPARFPQAYHMARAATFGPDRAPELSKSLEAQVLGFRSANPFAQGVHWSSGQELTIRLMAWAFAWNVFRRMGVPVDALTGAMAPVAVETGGHLLGNLEYARRSAYNNHLVAEALGLYLAGWLAREHPRSAKWRHTGLSLLEEQADRQIYRDGAYLNHSHNYHRAVMQLYLWAWACRRADGEAPPRSWRAGLERSLDFLLAHQNSTDGRLPNFGANDGSLPSVFSGCDFSDFRPTLQALSVATRGERVYPPGPWDEESAWLCGPESCALPIRRLARTSVSFAFSGYHVLRGRAEDSFGAFRCGTLRERFSQIDMLHLDVWWRGLNVLVDGGSYLYNGPREWHDHFFRTSSHNTVEIDGRDQMLHLRPFKPVYWTRAKLLRFEDREGWSVCAGEHFGYRRHPGECVHRRSILFVKDDLWVVADRILGHGRRRVRLQWLCGPFQHRYDPGRARLTLNTPAGPFSVSTLEERGRPMGGTVVTGGIDPPRGWLSRYYGERTPAPSLAVEFDTEVPVALVSVLSAGNPEVSVKGSEWSILREGGRTRFRLGDGGFEDVSHHAIP